VDVLDVCRILFACTADDDSRTMFSSRTKSKALGAPAGGTILTILLASLASSYTIEARSEVRTQHLQEDVKSIGFLMVGDKKLFAFFNDASCTATRLYGRR
jgi:hypothetical protein